MHQLRRRSTILALAAALVAAPAAAQNADLETITVALTTNTAQEWGFDVAQTLGFFAANGVKVETFVVGSSAASALQLAAGSADIATVSTTQVVLAIEGGAPIVEVFKNITTTPYTLVARKGLTSTAQLRGKTIMIGGPNDVTRPFMDKMMAAYGFKPGEYTYTYAGAVAERYAALLSGGIDATLLSPPVTFRAIADGYPVLDEVQRYYPAFATSGYAARIPWAQSHPRAMDGFMRAFLRGVRWLYDPANKARALQILEDNTKSSPEDAEKTYALYLTRERLLPVDGRFAPADFPQVIDVLVRTKQIPPGTRSASRFYDNRYVDGAAAELRSRR